MFNALKSVFIYRNLILQLVKRDIKSRYQGAFIGAFWSILFPLLSLGMYVFVFGVILKPRWPNVEGSLQFTLILFSGLLIFNFFSECVTRAPLLLVANANFVKKVVFPVEILIWIPIAAGFFNFGIGFIIFLILNILVGYGLSWTFLFLPLVFFPLIIFVAGLSWFLSALGVYVRDVTQVIGIIMQMMLYFAPIIYPREALSTDFRWVMLLNPLTIPVEQFRNIVNFSSALNWIQILIYWVVAIIFFLLGKLFFNKCRHGFADVV